MFNMHFPGEDDLHGQNNPPYDQSPSSTHTSGFVLVPSFDSGGQSRRTAPTAGRLDTHADPSYTACQDYSESPQSLRYADYSSATTSDGGPNVIYTPSGDATSFRDIGTQRSGTRMEHSLSSSSWSLGALLQDNVETYPRLESDTSLELMNSLGYEDEKPDTLVQTKGDTPNIIDGDGYQFGPGCQVDGLANVDGQGVQFGPDSQRDNATNNHGNEGHLGLAAANSFPSDLQEPATTNMGKSILDPPSPPWNPVVAAFRDRYQLNDFRLQRIMMGSMPQAAMLTEQPHMAHGVSKLPKKRKMSRSSTAKSNAPSQRRRIWCGAKTTCWRCIVTKEKCEDGIPCKICLGIRARKGPICWDITCCSYHLEEEAELLYPTTLTDRLEKGWIQQYVLDNVDILLTKMTHQKESFDVPLTAGFGPDIVVVGRRLIPKRLELMRFRGLSSKNRGKSAIIDGQVLPITIRGKTWETTSKINHWLDDLFREGLESWFGFVSRNNLHSWIRPVLKVIYNYYESSKDDNVRSCGEEPFSFDDHEERLEDKILRLAFKMAMAVTVLTYGLCIEERAVQPLWRKIAEQEQPPENGQKLPRVMNKILKRCVYISLQQLTKETLSGLDQLLRAKVNGETRRGHLFCILALLSISVSMEQVALLDLCIRANPDCPPSNAYVSDKVTSEISEMEDRLHHVPVLVAQRKFKMDLWNPNRRNSKHSELDEHSRKLVNDLRAIPGIEIELDQFLEPEPLKIINFWSNFPDSMMNIKQFQDMDKETAAMTNAPRLLSKLLYPLFGELTHDRRRK